jgi:DNA-binding beta-propeller fold protein YncE
LRAAVLLVGLAALGGGTPVGAQEPSAGCLPQEASATGTARTVVDSSGENVEEVTVPTGDQPRSIAIDATDTWGRVTVANRGDDRVTILFGRSPDLQVACQLPVGSRQPNSVALESDTGRVLVTMAGEPGVSGPRVVIVDARADRPSVVGSIPLPADPGAIAIDEQSGRAFVSLPSLGQVAMFERDDEDAYQPAATLESGAFATRLAVDPDTGRLIVSNEGQAPDVEGDQGNGTISIFDARAPVPEPIGEPIAAGLPTGIAFDPQSGNAYVLENGPDRLVTIAFPEGGAPQAANRMPIEPSVGGTQRLNPTELLFLPATRELVVTLRRTDGGPGHLDVLSLDGDGVASYARSIPAAQETSGIALDPVSGRVFVSYYSDDALAALRLDQPSAPAPPPSIVEALPSPTEISFAPQDVARTVGISLLVLLLVGAPTPLFNETLESNLGTIQGWFRRLVPARGSNPTTQRLGDTLRRFSASPAGLVGYLAVAAIIYSFLTPGFPWDNGLIVFGVALLGIGAATAFDIVPGQRYVIGKYRDRGTVRVALWTLVLAAICVLISRLSGMNPGYMYGIIGTFTFAAALTLGDEGRMEARGAVALLVLALAVWFARIPFEPAPGVPASGVNLIINAGLVGIFVVAVEGLVFGLVPLQFLPGKKIWAWSRWRWVVLWGAGLALFAHVLVYPVTVAQPNPDPSSLTTTLTSVALYGAIAVGFWAYFRWRAGHSGGGSEHADAPEPAS